MKTIVKSFAEFLGAINGRTVTLDGVEGTLSIEKGDRIVHRATAKGRKSERYQTIRRQLRDDYSSDVSDSDKALETICKALRITYV